MFETTKPGDASRPTPDVKFEVYGTFSYEALAAVLRVQVDTLYRWVRAGRVRQPTMFGDRPRWSAAVVRKIIAEGTKPAGTFPPADHNRVIGSRAKGVNAGRTKTPRAKPKPTGTKGKLTRPAQVNRKRGEE